MDLLASTRRLNASRRAPRGEQRGDDGAYARPAEPYGALQRTLLFLIFELPRGEMPKLPFFSGNARIHRRVSFRSLSEILLALATFNGERWPAYRRTSCYGCRGRP
jgi:hypothetical protein